MIIIMFTIIVLIQFTFPPFYVCVCVRVSCVLSSVCVYICLVGLTSSLRRVVTSSSVGPRMGPLTPPLDYHHHSHSFSVFGASFFPLSCVYVCVYLGYFVYMSMYVYMCCLTSSLSSVVMSSSVGPRIGPLVPHSITSIIYLIFCFPPFMCVCVA
jgi:hypothetical protein